jgi:chitin synthase
MLDTEEVSVSATSYFDNSDAVKGLLKQGNGLLAILDDQGRRGRTDMQFLESLRKRFENKNPAIHVDSATATLPGSNFATQNSAAAFSVKHFAGEVQYPVATLVEQNGETISGDLMNLINSTRSDFIRELFGQEALNTVVHPKEKTTIMQAQVSSKPLRMPSVMRKRGERPSKPGPATKSLAFGANDDADSGSESGRTSGQIARGRNESSGQGVAAQFLSSLDNVNKSLTAANTNPYFVFCLKPNDRRIANQFDSKCVRTQMQTFGIAEISQRLRNADFSIFLPFAEFLGLAEAEAIVVGSEREKAEMVLDEKRWPGNEARVGSTGVFLSERCWAEIAKSSDGTFNSSRMISANSEDGGDGLLTPVESGYRASKDRLIGNSPSPGAFIYGDETKGAGYFGSRDLDARSDAGASAFNSGDMFRNLETREQMAEKGNEKKMEEVEEIVVSGSRKRWLAVVWLITFYIPDFLISWIGRMKRKDVREAWREKFAINLLIWLSCLFVAFFIGRASHENHSPHLPPPPQKNADADLF